MIVTTASIGPDSTLVLAADARLNPIRATIVPVTTGGITSGIQPAPATCTTAPTTASATPVITIPPRASEIDGPSSRDCPWTSGAIAATGASRAKLLPR